MKTITKAEILRDADVLYGLVREMVLLHDQGMLSQEEHEWAEEQWVFKAIAALASLAGFGEETP